jgi:hypothetical protein
VAGNRLHRRLRGRIDRAFFRSSYDARQVLQQLAEQARLATSREDLAALIDDHVCTALLPRSLSVYLERRPGALECITAPAGEREVLDTAAPALATLAQRGRPLELLEEVAVAESLPAALSLERPECLVPILGRDGRLSGLVSLGTRLSEEPYSREDKTLLAWRPCAWPRRSPSVWTRSGGPPTSRTSRSRCNDACCRRKSRRWRRWSTPDAASRLGRWAVTTSTSWTWARGTWAWCWPTSRARASRRLC